MSKIKVEELSVYYGKTRALNNINLTINDNEFVAFVGQNGSGKSTLLKSMLGLIEPTNGKITITNGATEPTIGYVPQFSSFDKTFPISVREVVLMGAIKGKVSFLFRYSNKDKERANEMMKLLNIYEFRKRHISQLSGGQLQRVLIARALMCNPDIILLDEPTASLDVDAKKHIYEILKELSKDRTVVLISHDAGIISKYVDKVALLNQRLVYYGTPADMFSKGITLESCACDVIEDIGMEG